MGSLPLADAVEQSSARPTELRTKINLPLGASLSRALPYAAVGLRRARGATSAPADAPTRETPACVRCSGTMSCVGLRRAG